jgi:biotin synthase
MDAAPTTAYLMLGERCRRDCAFCTQARTSAAHASQLSRVSWPAYAPLRVAQAIDQAHAAGAIHRACFQVTVGERQLETTLEAILSLSAASAVPICVSFAPRNVAEVGQLLAAGADRVTIALDAATQRTYALSKGPGWSRVWRLLTDCAAAFPGHISTHLIVGLGDTEEQLVGRIADLHALGVTVGLFAFTPVAGTAMQDVAPPDLGAYRRVQVARWLLVYHAIARADLKFAENGRLVSVGLSATELEQALGAGGAFRTSGCPDCNRPYYNERPGGPLYNYPQPLTRPQLDQEIGMLLSQWLPSREPS